LLRLHLPLNGKV